MTASLARRSAWRLVSLVAALFACLGGASVGLDSARAAELLYWDNYDANSISFANVDGTGGGPLNLTGVELDSPEGLAYDTLTNRLYVGNESGGLPDGEISYVNLDGSGGGTLSTPGVTPQFPEGVVIDPSTRIIYWTNDDATDSIGWARLDGSGGGLLNTTGATVVSPARITFDPATGKVLWVNDEVGPDSVGFARVDNSGGGDLDLSGAGPVEELKGIAVDSAAGRVYLLDNETGTVSFVSINGGAGGALNMTGATSGDPYGLAVDPALSRIYWGNYGATGPAAAIGLTSTANLGGSAIGIGSAPVDGPQDPLIIKSPVGSAAPTLVRAAKQRASLTCTSGAWAPDLPGSFVYQAPRTYAYQWSLNGKPLAGATATTLKAGKPGKYTCTVTATNQAGAATQTSSAVRVAASKAKLTTKKKATVKPGGVATFPIKIANQGDLKSKNAKLCAILPKASKAALKAPKCKALGKLKGKGKKSAKLKIKALPSAAAGVYKVSFKVKGTAGKAAKAKIVVN